MTHCETLNVEADRLAGSFHARKRRQHSFAPELLKGAGCLVRINKTVITSKLPQLLREASSTQDLCSYLSDKFNWKTKELDDIDWSALGTATSRLPSELRPFVQKMNIGWLPLLKFLKKQDDDECDRCPSCNGDPEDFNHFLRCTQAARRSKWTTFLEHMDVFFKSTCTDHGLRKILRKAFRHLSGADKTPMESTQDHYQQLWQSQARLGWPQLLHGRLSQSWATAQEAHLRAMRKDGPDTQARLSTLSGDKWVIALIKKVWTFLHQLWKLRNNDLHGTDKKSDSPRARERLKQTIHALFELRTRLGAADRDIYPDFEDLMQSPNIHMEKWLHYARPFIIRAVKQEDSRIKQGTQDIRPYFRPDQRTHPRQDASTEKPP